MKFEVDTESRVDVFLASQKDLDLSRTRIQELISNQFVTVNGIAIRKSRFVVFPGNIVEIEIPEPKSSSIEPEDLPLDIIFEDSDLLVINKARGMVVHPAPGNESGTLVNALLFHCRDNLSGINGVERPGIVHRLDKDTSGVMLAAKTELAHRSLSEQIRKKSAKRIYLAIVHGTFSIESGIIEGSIGRDPNAPMKRAIIPNGKPATTRFRVLENFPRENLSLIECRLETGRTHQIRVHMSSIGHALLGDPKYSPNEKKSPDRFSIEGQALHSWKIEFQHPRTREIMRFEAQIPPDMKKIIETLSTTFF